MWSVMRRRALQRARIGEGGASTFMWEPEPGMTGYPTRMAAMRAIAVVMCGIPADATDDHVRLHWGRYQRNVGHHKIAKAEGA